MGAETSSCAPLGSNAARQTSSSWIAARAQDSWRAQGCSREARGKDAVAGWLERLHQPVERTACSTPPPSHGLCQPTSTGHTPRPSPSEQQPCHLPALQSLPQLGNLLELAEGTLAIIQVFIKTLGSSDLGGVPLSAAASWPPRC